MDLARSDKDCLPSQGCEEDQNQEEVVTDHVHVLLPWLPADGEEDLVQREQGDQV